ncbi:hypothetical protein C1H46_001967 [Malus baccata]|uniref:FAD-dependent oxidoreductase domain-containing protein 1 n=1 Tax=Malus baccata TaxID=106549 RepID=A0A540NMR1_MALBA|nr:hypothetical protein C1H46_001967 [Malus baccata]
MTHPLLPLKRRVVSREYSAFPLHQRSPRINRNRGKSTKLPHTNDAVSSLRSHFKPSSFASGPPSTSFGSSKFVSKSLSLRTAATRSGRPEAATLSHSESQSDQTFDVLVNGAGIIGLTIARQFLIGSDLSVAVIDKSVPCSGATGAGSLLVGRTPEDSDVLKKRVKQVCEAGLRAEYLSSSDLHVKEPELLIDKDTGVAFRPDDCQLDAHRGIEYLEQGNMNYASKGRYAEFYNHPVISLLRSGGNGEVVAIKTSRIHCTGHLLALENLNSFHLNHGLMEVGDVDHQTANLLPSISTSELLNQDEQTLSVSMTAIMDAMGNIILVTYESQAHVLQIQECLTSSYYDSLGSSRQFAEFCTELEESIISRIWDRAGEFFPKLKEKPLSDISKSREVRVGLRPYMPDGKPVIGPVPGLGTAEMLTDMVLGNSEKIISAPFTVHGRC